MRGNNLNGVNHSIDYNPCSVKWVWREELLQFFQKRWHFILSQIVSRNENVDVASEVVIMAAVWPREVKETTAGVQGRWDNNSRQLIQHKWWSCCVTVDICSICTKTQPQSTCAYMWLWWCCPGQVPSAIHTFDCHGCVSYAQQK